MQQLTIKTENSYIEQILVLLKKFPNTEVEVCEINPPHTPTQKSAFGLLKTPIVDPLKWQQKLRSENDSTLYSDTSI